ncbi:Multimeric flavodoxin WrbA [Arthrobacter subterraneus]|uniref:Multimeric flavodoxin WrbA n=1 Tax=Arthrobacter subterraneus TaxID=335973 RepID=A0A1G8IQX1_9MICC|nr:NAD(P)H-dependent oxidoreductase [Arthrobacter subterraneus]SDI21253.1 Multimeric flavodoxin WrbA [Arthrobacter subterraneus]
MANLKAFALICTLTPSPAESSSDLMANRILGRLEEQGVETSSARVVDHNVAPGVEVDMGNGDEWPELRRRILEADILLLAAPIWVGHMSSLGQRVFERLDADLSSTDDEGRPIMYNKVALTAVVGNEDGAHHVTAEMHQGLNDIGFTVPAQGGVYWVGEAMQTVDFKDLDQIPDPVASTISSMTANAVHLAQSLKSAPYPAP